MDDDHRELAHRLFAAATAMLEDATEAAVAGQSARSPSSKLAGHARTLQASARDSAVIAEAAMIVAGMGVNQHRTRSLKELDFSAKRSIAWWQQNAGPPLAC